MNEVVKATMDYYDKMRKIFSEKYNMDREDFSKHLANIAGYESFDNMSDDEKYAAFTIWEDHIKNTMEE